jgi:hypothetical protein
MGIVGLEMVSKFLKTIHPLLFILLVFGAVKRKKIPYEKEELFLLSVVAVFFLILLRGGTAFFYIGTRYMTAPAMLSLPWVGAGVLEVEYRAKNAFLSAKSNGIITALTRNLRWILLGLVVLALLPKTLASQRVEKIPIKEAGIWIRQNGPIGPVVMAQGQLRRITFYAEGIFIGIPQDQDLIEYAKRHRVDFLVVNEKDIEVSHPGLIHDLAPGYFEGEIAFGEPSGPYVIRIYSIKGSRQGRRPFDFNRPFQKRGKIGDTGQ